MLCKTSQASATAPFVPTSAIAVFSPSTVTLPSPFANNVNSMCRTARTATQTQEVQVQTKPGGYVVLEFALSIPKATCTANSNSYDHPQDHCLQDATYQSKAASKWGGVPGVQRQQASVILDLSDMIAIGRRFIFALNTQTKWILYIANTLALWARPDRYEGPLIVFGAIAAVYFTEALKKVINQGRPAGAPFADPGMPSAHSLTSFFLASAWISMLPFQVFEQWLLWSVAATVAYLRVVCGYHSWAQIAVGAALGSFLGGIWVEMGRRLYQAFPNETFVAVWVLYLGMASVFMAKKMKAWTRHEKNL